MHTQTDTNTRGTKSNNTFQDLWWCTLLYFHKIQIENEMKDPKYMLSLQKLAIRLCSGFGPSTLLYFSCTAVLLGGNHSKQWSRHARLVPTPWIIDTLRYLGPGSFWVIISPNYFCPAKLWNGLSSGVKSWHFMTPWHKKSKDKKQWMYSFQKI